MDLLIAFDREHLFSFALSGLCFPGAYPGLTPRAVFLRRFAAKTCTIPPAAKHARSMTAERERSHRRLNVNGSTGGGCRALSSKNGEMGNPQKTLPGPRQ